MKSISMALGALVVVIAAACSGTGGPGASQGVTPTTAGQPTPAAQPTQAGLPTAPAIPTPPVVPPPAGAGTVSVTLSGGPDAGTYIGAEGIDTNCSLGVIGPGGWGVQYSILTAGPNDLSSLQLVSAAPGKADDEGAFFQGTEFLMTVTIGDFLQEAVKRDYEVAVYTENADKETTGTGSATVSDTGSTAVIHATGTTAEGVGIDATINCPSVIRQ